QTNSLNNKRTTLPKIRLCITLPYEHLVLTIQGDSDHPYIFFTQRLMKLERWDLTFDYKLAYKEFIENIPMSPDAPDEEIGGVRGCISEISNGKGGSNDTSLKSSRKIEHFS